MVVISTTQYPTCVQTGCVNINLGTNNNLYTEATNIVTTQLFQDCDQQQLELFTSGDFLPNIAPLSGCPARQPKEWINNTTPDPSLPPGCNQVIHTTGLQYNTYSTQITVNATQ